MTFHTNPGTPTILTPEAQQAVWFLGALVRIRVSGDDTGGTLDVLEQRGERGYGSPLHRHLIDEETFFVLEGELRVEVGGESHAAGPGAVAFLPRQLPHAFVVTSPEAWFLTVHTPGGFDRFTRAVGTPAADTTTPPDEALPDPADLAAMARSYGIEILGPPPAP